MKIFSSISLLILLTSDSFSLSYKFILENAYPSISRMNDSLVAFISSRNIHLFNTNSKSVVASIGHQITPIDSNTPGIFGLNKNFIFHSTVLDGFTVYKWNIYKEKNVTLFSYRFKDTLVIDYYCKNNNLYVATEFGIEFSKDFGKTWKLVTKDKTPDDYKRMSVNLPEMARKKTSFCRITEVDNQLFCVTSAGKIYSTDYDLKHIRFYFDLHWGGFSGNVAQVDSDYLLMQGSFSPIYLVRKKAPNKIDTLALTKEFARDARFCNVGNDIVLFPNHEKSCYIYNKATRQFDVYLDNENWGKIYSIIQEKDSRFIFTTTGVYILN